MLRRGKRLRAAIHIIYRAVRSLSTPLRPSAPGVHALRRRPSVHRPPFGARPAPAPPWITAVNRGKSCTESALPAIAAKTPPARTWSDSRRGEKPWKGSKKRPRCLGLCPAAQRFAADEAPQSVHTAARLCIHPPQRRPTRVNLSTVAPKEQATQDAQGNPRQSEVENHKKTGSVCYVVSKSVCGKDTPFSPHLRAPSSPFGRRAPSPLPRGHKCSTSRPDSPAVFPPLHPHGKKHTAFCILFPTFGKSPLVFPKSAHPLPHISPFAHRPGREAMENFTSAKRNCAEKRSRLVFLILVAFI